MSYIHKKHAIKATAMQRSLTRIVKRELINRGYETLYISTVDRYGARLMAFDLLAGDVHVMCRSVGYVLSPTDQGALDRTPGAYVQHGAVDLTGLIDHIARYSALQSASHWAQA